MIHKMYSIRDQKSEVFNKPWYAVTHGEAERSFAAAVNDKQTTLSAHPEDFDLYWIGEYDDNSGKIMPLDTPQHVVKAIQLKKSTQVAEMI